MPPGRFSKPVPKGQAGDTLELLGEKPAGCPLKERPLGAAREKAGSCLAEVRLGRPARWGSCGLGTWGKASPLRRRRPL